VSLTASPAEEMSSPTPSAVLQLLSVSAINNIPMNPKTSPGYVFSVNVLCETIAISDSFACANTMGTAAAANGSVVAGKPEVRRGDAG
jgi:hypothetical protein